MIFVPNKYHLFMFKQKGLATVTKAIGNFVIITVGY